MIERVVLKMATLDLVLLTMFKARGDKNMYFHIVRKVVDPTIPLLGILAKELKTTYSIVLMPVYPCL